jgi:ribosome-binding protein aMBF1 (putative translation factor)
MSALTDYQIIKHNGTPAFVLVPYEQFNKIRPYLSHRQSLRDTIPHEVVEANLLNDVPIIKAWREYLGFTQAQLAEKSGMKQSALARIESGTITPRHSTIVKLAAAMELRAELLDGEEPEEMALAA